MGNLRLGIVYIWVVRSGLERRAAADCSRASRREGGCTRAAKIRVEVTGCALREDAKSAWF